MRMFLPALLALILSLSATFVSPSSAQVAVAAGDILVTAPASGTILHYSASGVDLGVFASELSSPWSITADRDGNIYVSEFDGLRISKFSPAGVNLLTITTVRPNSDPYRPGGVQVGGDGTIYVADYLGGNVYRYSAAGTGPVLFASSLTGADFMALDAGGNLYVTDFILAAVRRVSQAGVVGDFVAGFPGPAGIAFDADGNVYVASFLSNFIEKYSTSGADLGTFAPRDPLDPRSSILGIAFDALGNLYVANYALGNIHRFSPTGADLGVFASTGLANPRDLVIVPVGAAPTVKDECKQDGWQSFVPFKNQGDCIQFLNTGK